MTKDFHLFSIPTWNCVKSWLDDLAQPLKEEPYVKATRVHQRRVSLTTVLRNTCSRSRPGHVPQLHRKDKTVP